MITIKKSVFCVLASQIFIGALLHAEETKKAAEELVIPTQFFTREKQASLTPEDVLAKLKERNKDFVNENLTVRNTSERIRKAVSGQYPGAVILSCLDSRIPVEDVFHSGIGDLFVARVAGNTSNPEILGSLEFACKVAGSKVIVVMGHDNCGAIRSAIDNVQMGNITALLHPIRQAMETITDFEGEKSSRNPAYVEAVCRANVRYTIQSIRENSPILKEMEANKEIYIVGAEYYLDTGEVEFWDRQ
jgi:carbonic anhydrase